jgi:cell wall-associated NlpC family hydrolase
MANASASNSPWPILTGQDTVPPVTAPLTPTPVIAAPDVPAPVPAPVVPTPVASKPTAVVAPATTVRLAARVVPKPTPRVVRTTFGQRVILEARKHFGARYRWGATGPYQFDCSGLTSYVFRKLGVRLPRTAQQQFNAVRHVSHASARVGDLIFKYGRGGAVYHVGIYAGRGRMIDAPHSGTVVRLERITGRYKVGRVR